MTTENMDQVKAAFLERMSLGHSVRTICEAPGMPGRTTVRNWLAADEAFAEQYKEAQRAGWQALADEIIHIADTPMMGETQTTKPDGGIEVKRADMIEHRRLQIDARKWMLAKMIPRTYGEKVAIGGADDLPPVQSSLDVSNLPTEVLTAIMKARDAADGG